MKIAFASCFDAVDDSQQVVWNQIKSQSPDVLLLLGDSVYMDYGILGERRLGWPRKVSNDEFAATLYSRYQNQWNVPSFRRLVTSGIKIGATWDDHDFAWNNSRGAGTEKKSAVSRDKRLISKSLFLQFRETIRIHHDSSYPAMPDVATMLQTPDEGIQEMFDVGIVRIVMLDGRSFREDPNEIPNAEMHGREQRRWLANLINGWNGLSIVGAGSVLTHSAECWEQYLDYAWLLEQPAERVVVLTGDIHKNVPPLRHRDSPPLYEITSSGAARPGLGGNKGNFGIIHVGESISATLHSKEHPEGVVFGLAF